MSVCACVYYGGRMKVYYYEMAQWFINHRLIGTDVGVDMVGCIDVAICVCLCVR